MEYLETLPDQCPTSAAKDIAVNAVYRIVSGPNPGIDAFLSNAGLKLTKPPTVDNCRWASCSLFKSRDKAANVANKLANTRINNPHLTLCDIKIGCGKSFINTKSHVDFWPFSNFELSKVVLKTEKV